MNVVLTKLKIKTHDTSDPSRIGAIMNLKNKPEASKKQKKLEQNIAQINKKSAQLKAQIDRLNAKSHAQDIARNKRRRNLPLKINDLPNEHQSIDYVPDGFSVETGKSVISVFIDALSRDTFAAILDAFSDVFLCDRLEIAIIEKRTIQRNGKKLNVVSVRYGFNKSANDGLMTIPNTRFNGSAAKSWDIEMTEDNIHKMWSVLKQHFVVVLDVDLLCVFVNNDKPTHSFANSAAFTSLPSPLSWNASQIIDAIQQKTKDIPINFYVHNGIQFVPIDLNSEYDTYVPFILCRYSVNGGQPRYVAYSVIGKCIENLSFQSDGKNMKRMIARYIDTLRTIKAIAFSPRDPNHAVSTQAEWDNYRGGFDRFAQEIAHINSCVEGITITPLCSDYVSMSSNGYGADTSAANIAAYVMINDTDLLSRIASFFDKDVGRFPIVFDRKYLDEIHNKNNPYFFYTLVSHEVAHHIAPQIFKDKKTDHGIKWAIVSDIIRSIFLRDFDNNFTELEYYSNDTNLCRIVQDSVTNYAIPFLISRESKQKLTLEDVSCSALIAFEYVESVLNIAEKD